MAEKAWIGAGEVTCTEGAGVGLNRFGAALVGRDLDGDEKKDRVVGNR